MTTKPVALVTGATGGMGTEIVTDLARTHTVIAQGRNTQKLAALAKIPGVITWQAELTAEHKTTEFITQLERLDVVVHAAAIASTETLANASTASWQQQFAVNVIAPATITRAALPLLRQSQGTVIFIGSGASVRANPNSAVYTASKHALKGLADCLRLDEQQYRVRVTTVAPGPTDTEMLRGLIAPENYRAEQYIHPASVAKAVRFVVDATCDVQLSDVFVRPRAEVTR